MKIVSENEWPTGQRSRPNRWAQVIQWVQQGHCVMLTPEDYLPTTIAAASSSIYSAGKPRGVRLSVRHADGNIYVRLRPTNETTGETK